MVSGLAAVAPGSRTTCLPLLRSIRVAGSPTCRPSSPVTNDTPGEPHSWQALWLRLVNRRLYPVFIIPEPASSPASARVRSAALHARVPPAGAGAAGCGAAVSRVVVSGPAVSGAAVAVADPAEDSGVVVVGMGAVLPHPLSAAAATRVVITAAAERRPRRTNVDNLVGSTPRSLGAGGRWVGRDTPPGRAVNGPADMVGPVVDRSSTGCFWPAASAPDAPGEPISTARRQPNTDHRAAFRILLVAETAERGIVGYLLGTSSPTEVNYNASNGFVRCRSRLAIRESFPRVVRARSTWPTGI